MVGTWSTVSFQADRYVCAAFMELGLVYGKGVDEEGFEDRAYRLYYNKSQNRTDRFAGVRTAFALHLMCLSCGHLKTLFRPYQQQQQNCVCV